MLVLWLLANLLQSALTPLSEDEAYYWMYSRYLAWGYFDHPPMIALFVKMGSSFFQGALGVRLATAIAQLAALWLMWRTIDEPTPSKQNILRFFCIAASVAMFQVYGFVATPDSPLLLFTAFFLFAYKKYLARPHWGDMALLALSMSGLIYSKYQGGLVILLVILSNLRLLAQWRFWAAGLAAIALLLPHIHWQVANNFPSLQYHLLDRSRPFKLGYFLEYWPNQLAVFNPFFLGLAIFVLIKYRPKDVFERAIWVLAIGFWMFFWATSLRGHVEPHWTIAASIGLIILVYQKSIENKSIDKYIKHVLGPSIGLLVLGRIILALDILPIKTPFNSAQAWAADLAKTVGDRTMVFENSYQKPSLYTFYTGRPATTFNNIFYRKNQYDIWPFEEQLQGKKAVISTNADDSLAVAHELPNGNKMYLHFTDSLFSVQRLSLEFDLPEGGLIKGQQASLPLRVFNPYPYSLRLDHKEFPVSFKIVLAQHQKEWIADATPEPVLTEIGAGKTMGTQLVFTLPDSLAGQPQIGVCLVAGPLREAFNSRFSHIEIH